MSIIELSGTSLEQLLPKLKEQDQWMCWYTHSEKDGKFRKKPYAYNDDCTFYEPGVARYTDEGNWLSYTEAYQIFNDYEEVTGVGFVFSDQDNFVALDIDYCISTEGLRMKNGALDIINKSKSYTELSPSKTGIHVLLQGEIPRQGWTTQPNDFRIEIYDQFFLTVSQNHIQDTPLEINFNQEFLDDIFSKYHISWPNPKFTSFWPERNLR